MSIKDKYKKKKEKLKEKLKPLLDAFQHQKTDDPAQGGISGSDDQLAAMAAEDEDLKQDMTPYQFPMQENFDKQQGTNLPTHKVGSWRDAGITRPEYETTLREGGGLKEQYNLKSNYDSTYEEYLANYAQSQTPSPWLSAQNELLSAENQVDRELETRNRMSQMTKAQDAMALGGGMQSGSAEMLAGRGLEAKVSGGQAVQDKFNQQRLSSLQQDQDAKRGTLQDLSQFAPGVASYKTAIDKSNIGSILGEREKAYGANRGAYGEEMSAWASEQLSDAMYARA